jgi:hypothetical protein
MRHRLAIMPWADHIGALVMAKQEANWVNIDTDSLAPHQLEAYDAYKGAYRAMKTSRENFENIMGRDIPAGQRMIFGYNFGKLSVAVVEDDRKVPKAKAATQSLSDFLASAKAHGDRT